MRTNTAPKSVVNLQSKERPQFKMDQFEGPLDLLFHLIEKNDVDIYDIPITPITDQYMQYLDKMHAMDMDIASDFLVMAATLIHIKSRMLLPGKQNVEKLGEDEDPREELVIRLLHYRRCKVLAGDLRQRYKMYSDSYTKLPSTPHTLDVSLVSPPQEFDSDCFLQAMRSVCARNEIRFADISSKITHILKRDKSSVRERMKMVWQVLVNKGKIFFHELFPSCESDKTDRVVGFLAVLELLRSNKISAQQEKPFDVILISQKEDRPRKDSRMYLKESGTVQKEKVIDER